MSRTDGGPAFPELTMGHDGPSGTQNHRTIRFESTGGMTLRDYFAGQMLQAISGSVAAARAAGGTPDGVAETCYSMADHMLQERDK